jgi:hypothetical protein
MSRGTDGPALAPRQAGTEDVLEAVMGISGFQPREPRGLLTADSDGFMGSYTNFSAHCAADCAEA